MSIASISLSSFDMCNFIDISKGITWQLDIGVPSNAMLALYVRVCLPLDPYYVVYPQDSLAILSQSNHHMPWTLIPVRMDLDPPVSLRRARVLVGNSTHLMRWIPLTKPGYITPTRCSLRVKMGVSSYNIVHGEMSLIYFTPFHFNLCMYLLTVII